MLESSITYSSYCLSEENKHKKRTIIIKAPKCNRKKINMNKIKEEPGITRICHSINFKCIASER